MGSPLCAAHTLGAGGAGRPCAWLNCPLGQQVGAVQEVRPRRQGEGASPESPLASLVPSGAGLWATRGAQHQAPVWWLPRTCEGAGAGGQPLPLFHLLQGCSGGGDSLLRAGTGSQHRQAPVHAAVPPGRDRGGLMAVGRWERTGLALPGGSPRACAITAEPGTAGQGH